MQSFPPVPWLQNLHSSSSSALSTITPTTVVPSRHQNSNENPVKSPPSSLATAVTVTPSTSETTASSGGTNPASRKIIDLSLRDFALQLEI
jgi:septal ring-binding cell division protein DamX